MAIELDPRLAEVRGLEARRELLLRVQDALAELDDEQETVASWPPFRPDSPRD